MSVRRRLIFEVCVDHCVLMGGEEGDQLKGGCWLGLGFGE